MSRFWAEPGGCRLRSGVSTAQSGGHGVEHSVGGCSEERRECPELSTRPSRAQASSPGRVPGSHPGPGSLRGAPVPSDAGLRSLSLFGKAKWKAQKEAGFAGLWAAQHSPRGAAAGAVPWHLVPRSRTSEVEHFINILPLAPGCNSRGDSQPTGSRQSGTAGRAEPRRGSGAGALPACPTEFLCRAFSVSLQRGAAM